MLTLSFPSSVPKRFLILLVGGMFLIWASVWIRSVEIGQYRHDTEQAASVVNHAGKIRYLSQRTAMYALLLPQAKTTKDALQTQHSLIEATENLRIQVHFLTDTLPKLPSIFSPSSLALYNRIDSLANQYQRKLIPSATPLAASLTTPQVPAQDRSPEQILKDSEEMLTMADKGVESLEQDFRARSEDLKVFQAVSLLFVNIIIACVVWLLVRAFLKYKILQEQSGFDVSMRTTLEEQLKKEREQTTKIMNAIHVIAWEADAETFEFSYVNHAAERLLGYPTKQWTTEPLFWQNHIHPDDRAEKLQFCIESTRALRDHDFEYRFIKADGSIAWLRDMVTVVVHDGKAVMLRGVMVDITEQKKSEQALKDSEQRLSLALEGGNLGLWDWDALSNKLIVNERWLSMLGLNPSTTMPTLDFWHSLVHPEDMPILQNQIDKVISNPNGKRVEAEVRAKHANGEYIWILDKGGIVSRDNNGNPLRIVGTHMDITEQKRAEKELRSSEERFRSLFLYSKDAIFETIVDGLIINANPEACRMFGRTVEEFRQLGRAGVVDMTDSRLPVLLQERAEKGSAFGELTFIRSDGTHFPGEISSTIFTASDGLKYTSMIIRDVSARKEAERIAKESQKQLAHAKQLLDETGSVARIGGWEYFVSSGTLSWTAATYDIYELPYDADLSVELATSYYHPDNQAIITAALERLTTNAESYDLELRFITAKGNPHWVRTIGKCEQDADNAVTRLYGTFQDITNQVEEREQLKERQHFISTLLDTMPGAVYIFDIEENRNIFATDSHRKLIGYSAEEIQAMGTSFIEKCFHPDEAEGLNNHLARLFDNPLGTVSELTYRFRHKDGHWMWLLSREIVLQRDTVTGKNKQHLGVVIEITSLKAAETELAASNTRLRTLLAAIPVPVALSRVSDGKVLFNNAPLQKILGLSPNTDEHPQILDFYVNPEDRTRILENLQATGYVDNLELPLKSATGEIWYALASKVLMVFEGEQVVFGAFNNITERKQAEAALQQSEANLRAVFDASVQALYLIDADFRILAYNKVSAEKVYQLSRRDIVIGGDIRDDILPTDREAFEENFRSALRGNFIRTERAVAFKNNVLWFEFRYVPVFDASGSIIGISFSALDITESKQASEILALSEMRYRSFVELQSTYFTRTDLEGRYTYANPSLLKDFSPNQESVIGKHGFIHIIPEDHALTLATVERCLLNPGMSVPVTLRKPHISGEIYWTEWEFIAIKNSEGIVSEIQCVGHNITAGRKAEDELKALNQTLEKRVERRTRELVVLNNEKNEFLGIAAHDLKNPLAGILSSAEILERYYSNNIDVKRFVGMVMSASNQMLEIITNLLDVNKIESGLMNLAIEPVSLEILDGIVEDYQARAAHKGIILHYQSPERDSAWILADVIAVRQIFDNLISNAIKYSPQWKNVWVRINSTEEHGERFVRIEIQDEGPGLSESDKQKLFQKFARLSAQPTGGENSTGLGLSIVKKLVDLHHGRVWCESVLGKGTTFIVEFPRT